MRRKAAHHRRRPTPRQAAEAPYAETHAVARKRLPDRDQTDDAAGTGAAGARFDKPRLIFVRQPSNIARTAKEKLLCAFDILY